VIIKYLITPYSRRYTLRYRVKNILKLILFELIRVITYFFSDTTCD